MPQNNHQEIMCKNKQEKISTIWMGKEMKGIVNLAWGQR